MNHFAPLKLFCRLFSAVWQLRFGLKPCDVQALPVLSEPSTDNAISWATAFYANSLAGYIANSQPRIKAVFDNWRLSGGTKETFLSRLEQNQDVKNILLGESPWLLEATTEAEQQQRIATLFDVNQLNIGRVADNR